MGERRSFSSMHVFWRDIEGIAGGWYIETRNAYNEEVDNSRHPAWDGPPPKNYQRQDAETLRAHLQLWEPEARVVMHVDAM
ncbi:MAG: hypothetical protein FJZ47_10410 [Candidatus Tectomicrobia bacterium]|uniref:Uncharacterized protein n=1 Tax=Tectimicrobiota bacterium TaxID=2528274 RepID=A0A938B0V2_UNCTE|nr:hypothetical protein [Candidatus Tectomicrobia bacterium]